MGNRNQNRRLVPTPSGRNGEARVRQRDSSSSSESSRSRSPVIRSRSSSRSSRSSSRSSSSSSGSSSRSSSSSSGSSSELNGFYELFTMSQPPLNQSAVCRPISRPQLKRTVLTAIRILPRSSLSPQPTFNHEEVTLPFYAPSVGRPIVSSIPVTSRASVIPPRTSTPSQSLLNRAGVNSTFNTLQTRPSVNMPSASITSQSLLNRATFNDWSSVGRPIDRPLSYSSVQSPTSVIPPRPSTTPQTSFNPAGLCRPSRPILRAIRILPTPSFIPSRASATVQSPSDGARVNVMPQNEVAAVIDLTGSVTNMSWSETETSDTNISPRTPTASQSLLNRATFYSVDRPIVSSVSTQSRVSVIPPRPPLRSQPPPLSPPPSSTNVTLSEPGTSGTNTELPTELRSGDAICSVCMCEVVNCVLLFCGHLCACLTCGKKMKRCPICRARIRRVVRTFKC